MEFCDTLYLNQHGAISRGSSVNDITVVREVIALSYLESSMSKIRDRANLSPFSSPYTFFLLNGDMELYRNRHLFVEEMF